MALNLPNGSNNRNTMLPGGPKRLVGNKEHQYEDLLAIGATAPFVLTKALDRSLIDRRWSTTPIGILMHLKGGVKSMNRMEQNEGISSLNGAGATRVNSFDIRYPIYTPDVNFYNILQAPTADANGNVGANGTDFTLIFENNDVAQDEQYKTGDDRQVFQVRSVRELAGGRIEATCFLPNGRLTQGVPVTHFALGSKPRRLGNFKSLRSTTGSTFSDLFNFYGRTSISTSRYQIGYEHVIRDIALRDKKNREYSFKVEDEKGKDITNGKMFLDHKVAQMFEKAAMERLNMIWHGVRPVDANGNQLRDAEGAPYIAYDGMEQQATANNFIAYNSVSLNLLNDIALKMRRNAIACRGGRKLTLAIMGGLMLEQGLSSIFANEFKLNPLAFYADENINSTARGVIAEKTDVKLRGVNAHFNFYSTAIADFVIVPCEYFNNIYRRGARFRDGTFSNDWEGYVVDITDCVGNQDTQGIIPQNVEFLQFRDPAFGIIKGLGHNPNSFSMRSLGFDANDAAAITHPREGSEMHLRIDFGVAVMNPNFMMKIYRQPEL